MLPKIAQEEVPAPLFTSVGVSVKNLTNEKKTFRLFSLTHPLASNSELEVAFHGDYDLLMTTCGSRTPAIGLMRLKSTNVSQWLEPFNAIKRDVNRTETLSFLPFMLLNLMQQQRTLIDILFRMTINGLQELEFSVLPNTTLSITLFPDHIAHGGISAQLLRDYDIIEANQRVKNGEVPIKLTNTTDMTQEVTLFDKTKFTAYNFGNPQGVIVEYAWNYDRLMNQINSGQANLPFNAVKIYTENKKQFSQKIDICKSGEEKSTVIHSILPRTKINAAQNQPQMADFICNEDLSGYVITGNEPVKITIEPKTTAHYVFYNLTENAGSELNTKFSKQIASFKSGTEAVMLNEDRYNVMRLYLHPDFDYSLPVSINGHTFYPLLYVDIYKAIADFVDIGFPETTLKNFKFESGQPIEFDLLHHKSAAFVENKGVSIVTLENDSDQTKEMEIAAPDESGLLIIYSKNVSQILQNITYSNAGKDIDMDKNTIRPEAYFSAYQYQANFIQIPYAFTKEFLPLKVSVLAHTKAVYAFCDGKRFVSINTMGK